MEGVEEASSGLQAAAEAWLASLPAAAVESPPDGGPLLLDVPLLELAASQAHDEFFAALLACPEAARQAVAEVLTGAGLLGPGQRVWLRPRQLPAPLEVGVSEALSQLRTASGSLLAVHGVCVAATAVFQRPAVRAFQCAACERLCVLHSLARPPPCCGDGTAGGMVHEVEAARVMVPAQTVFLCTDDPLPAAPAPQLGAALLAVHLADDLAGQVRVGDRLLVTGGAGFHGGAPAVLAPGAHLPLTLGCHLDACGLQVLTPAAEAARHGGGEELGPQAARHLSAMAPPPEGDSSDAACTQLQVILDVFDAALPAAASPLLRLGVLLSAAAAGTGSTELGGGGEGVGGMYDPEPQANLQRRAVATRNQVNIMLTSAAPEPHVQRFLRAAAATLCGHSVVAAPADPRRLLPGLEPRFVEPVLGVPAPLVTGGQLGEAARGVLLLSSSGLDAKRAIALGQYVAAGEAALVPGCPDLCVPVGATLWTLVHEQDLSKAGGTEASTAAAAGGGTYHPGAGLEGSGGSKGLSLTERIINKYSHPFFSQHDILVGAGAESEEEVDLMADLTLLEASSSDAGSDPHALAALRTHLALARASPQPALLPAAAALLSAYFLHLRSTEGAQATVLASLARVAAAVARLRRAPQAEALPDAALAVAYVEEKLLRAGGAPAFWPRWREELARCTELGKCLRGLAGDAASATGGCGDGGGAAADADMRHEE